MNKARTNSVRSARTVGRSLVLLALLVGIGRPAALADHFEARRADIDGRDAGVVMGHQTDLFVITTSAGGLSATRRAEILADRLEQLAHARDLSLKDFRVGSRNGETVLLQQEDDDHPARILLTIDRGLASDGDVDRLANWWLALLKDHLALAQGREPIYTEGTPVGQVFHKLYESLGRPTEPVDWRDIDHAFENLSGADQRVLDAACAAVPSTFRRSKEVDREEEPARGNPPGTAKEEDKAPEAPGPALSKTSGDYQVRLLTDPQNIPRGKKAVLAFRLLRTTEPGGVKTVVTDATVRAWLSPVNARPGPSRPAEFDEETGTYRVSGLEFAAPGEYMLSVGVLPEESDPFKVAFTFSPGLVNDPDADKPGGTGKPAERVEQRKPTSIVKRAGDYTVTLTIDPDPPVVDGETNFSVKLVRTKDNAPVKDALLRVWTVAQKEGTDDLPTVKPEAKQADGTYAWHSRFTTASDFVVSIWITTPDKERLQVEFPLTVKARPGGTAGRPNEGEQK